MDLRPYLLCLSFYLLYFVLPPFEDNGLPFWVTDVLCQHSEVVLWNLLGIQMFFWWICGGRSRLPILLLRHLRTASLSCFSDDPVDVGNLISGSSAFSKTSLNIWKFMVHVLLKPDLENFKHHFTSVWDECNCVVVWAFFGIAFLWDWNENWPFPGFPCSSVGKESACSAGDPGLIPGLGRSPGEGNGYPLQYPCLENLMDRGAWWAAVHGVTKSRAWLSN